MSLFPDVIPSARVHTPAGYPVTRFASLGGQQARIRHGNIAAGQRLDLVFENITEAEMLSIRQHYRDHHRWQRSFNLQASAIEGETADWFEDEDYSWIYAGPIEIEDTQPDIHSLTVTLERVPEPAPLGWPIVSVPSVAVTTGQPARIRLPKVIRGNAASFTTTGQAALVLRGRAIVGQAAAFMTTGQPARMSVARIRGDAAAFTTTGQDAQLRRDRVIVGQAAAFTTTGQTATINAGTMGGNYFDSWTEQNAPWLPDYLPDWWGT